MLTLISNQRNKNVNHMAIQIFIQPIEENFSLILDASEDVEQRELSYIVSRHINWLFHLWQWGFTLDVCIGHDSASPLLNPYPRETHAHRYQKTSIQKYPPTWEWMNKLWYKLLTYYTKYSEVFLILERQ